MRRVNIYRGTFLFLRYFNVGFKNTVKEPVDSAFERHRNSSREVKVKCKAKQYPIIIPEERGNVDFAQTMWSKCIAANVRSLCKRTFYISVSAFTFASSRAQHLIRIISEEEEEGRSFRLLEAKFSIVTQIINIKIII